MQPYKRKASRMRGPHFKKYREVKNKGGMRQSLKPSKVEAVEMYKFDKLLESLNNEELIDDDPDISIQSNVGTRINPFGRTRHGHRSSRKKRFPGGKIKFIGYPELKGYTNAGPFFVSVYASSEDWDNDTDT